jgi:hypothetical protein
MLCYGCESILQGLWVSYRVKAGYMPYKNVFYYQQLYRVVLMILDDMLVTHCGTTISHSLTN